MVSDININLLLQKKREEQEKLLEFVVLLVLNCSNRDLFIDRVGELDEKYQTLILSIIEKYISLDGEQRESLVGRSVFY